MFEWVTQKSMIGPNQSSNRILFPSCSLISYGQAFGSNDKQLLHRVVPWDEFALFFFLGKNNCLKGISSKDIFKNIIFAHVVEYSTFQKGRA